MSARVHTAATIMCVRWLAEHHAGNVDRTSCFDYYEHHGHGTMGMETVSRRGAGGRMARRLHDLGLAVDGKLTEEAKRL